MKDEAIKREMITAYQEEAEKLGISLQEYLSFLILEKLDSLAYRED